MSLLKKEYHRAFFLAGCCLLAAGIPLSRYLMSIAQWVLLVNWLLEGDLRNKLRQFFGNRAALLFSSVYLMHLLGLCFTTDFDYALKDLRTKIPLALLPLVLSSSAGIPDKWLKRILLCFTAAVLAGTLAGFRIWLLHPVTDTREMSPFISHIRFSLSLCMAMVILIWILLVRRDHLSRVQQLAGWGIFLWFALYLYVSEYFTAYYILGGLVLVWLVVQAARVRKPLLKFALIICLLLLPGLAFLYLRGEYRAFFHPRAAQAEALDLFTPNGNRYLHDTARNEVISGHRLYQYFCEPELISEWEKRSVIPYDSAGHTGLKVSDVLIRYLTSRGLRKDSAGIAALDQREIRLIENGIADVEETRGSPVHKRLRKIFWEYQNYTNSGDPSGHSVMMRLEYWKASLAIFSEHSWTGVGTGDMNRVFEEYYERVDSRLKPEWRRRSHNQFLSVAVGFGIAGLLWFLAALLLPAIRSGGFRDFLFTAFFVIMILSFLPEDTIESQDGVTFTAFFYCLLLFGWLRKSP